MQQSHLKTLSQASKDVKQHFCRAHDLFSDLIKFPLQEKTIVVMVYHCQRIIDGSEASNLTCGVSVQSCRLYNGGFSPPDHGSSGLIGFLIRFSGSLTISPIVSSIVTVTV